MCEVPQLSNLLVNIGELVGIEVELRQKGVGEQGWRDDFKVLATKVENCPYVLSVGGTQLNSDETILDPEVVMFQPQLTKLNISGIPNVPATFSSSG